MIDQNTLNALAEYTKGMQNDVAFLVRCGEHAKRSELLQFLTSVASVSDRLSVTEVEAKDFPLLRGPLSFELTVNGESSGISFSGIPSGHEFNSLILAVLQLSGTPIKLDDSISDLVKNIQEVLTFEVFVSLSCHNCPDVVQALNQFATLNENIQVETIDGALFQDLVEERNIQGVPSVYLNGEPFANGKIDVGNLVEKLIERYPDLTASSVSSEPMETQDVTVIGGGPAGVAAAVYAARKGLKVTLIADVMGGQVKDTMGIENFISVPTTTGPELVAGLKAHLESYDITLKQHVKVDSITLESITLNKEDGHALKTLHLNSGAEIETKSIIVATGAKWRELGVPGEKENIGQGVAYCPHCDGPFFKGKDVAVIGGGNSGIEAAIDLAGIVNKVTVLEFMPTLKADDVLIKQAQKRDNIEILKNVATEEILADNGKVVALRYKERESGEITDLDLSAVFVQIGLVPNSQMLQDVVELSQYGEVVINDKCETNVPGIFACGDVTTVPFKQIVIAAGEGSKAALSAFNYLSQLD